MADLNSKLSAEGFMHAIEYTQDPGKLRRIGGGRSMDVGTMVASYCRGFSLEGLQKYHTETVTLDYDGKEQVVVVTVPCLQGEPYDSSVYWAADHYWLKK